MKIAWAFAARQRQADAVVEQRGALLAANRHEICQEANAECLLRSNTPEQAALRVATEDNWSCGVCYEEVCHPYTLPCGHTICGSCLEQLLLRETKCPFCRLSVFRGCTFGRNIAMWNAIQARHPEQAAALPKKAPVVTVQRRLRQASIRHRAAGNEAAAAASSSDYRSVPDPSLLNIVMTALLQDPRLLHTSARNSASSSRRLGMLSALPASDLSRGQSDQSADPTSLNTADVIAVLPHSQMDHPWTAHAYNPRLSSPLARLSAESILAATDAAHPRTTLMPDVSQMRRLTTS